MSLPQKRLMVFLFSPGQQVLPTSRRKLVLSVCLALVKPHQENCVQFWTPQYMRDMGNTGKSPTEVHQVDERLEYISCEESLRELVPFSLKKRRIRILNNCMKKYFVEILCRNTWGEGAKERETGSLLLLAAWTRGDGHKLFKYQETVYCVNNEEQEQVVQRSCEVSLGGLQMLSEHHPWQPALGIPV